MTNIFKYEPNEFEKILDASLAEFVKTIKVNQVELGEDKNPTKVLPKRNRRILSASDWDDCLKK